MLKQLKKSQTLISRSDQKDPVNFIPDSYLPRFHWVFAPFVNGLEQITIYHYLRLKFFDSQCYLFTCLLDWDLSHRNFWLWYSVFRRLVSRCRYRCDLCWWWIFVLAPPLGGGWNDRWGSLPFDSPLWSFIVFPVMNRTRWQHPSSYWADVGAAAYDKEVMSGGSVVCKGWQVGPPTQQFLFSEGTSEKTLKCLLLGS